MQPYLDFTLAYKCCFWSHLSGNSLGTKPTHSASEIHISSLYMRKFPVHMMMSWETVWCCILSQPPYIRAKFTHVASPGRDERWQVLCWRLLQCLWFLKTRSHFPAVSIVIVPWQTCLQASLQNIPASLRLWWEAGVDWTLRPEQSSIQTFSMIGVRSHRGFSSFYGLMKFVCLIHLPRLSIGSDLLKKAHNIPFIILSIVIERNVTICGSMQSSFF